MVALFRFVGAPHRKGRVLPYCVPPSGTLQTRVYETILANVEPRCYVRLLSMVSRMMSA